MSISANNVHRGLTIRYRDDLYEITNFDHVKPGKGSAFVKMRLKSLTTGRTLEDSVRPEDKLEDLFMEEVHMEYLYEQQGNYVFMDLASYEQVEFSKAQVEHVLPYLLENMEVRARENGGKYYGISLPKSVTLKVVSTAPNHKGDTNTGGKPAELQTGATVIVPFFIDVDDEIRVDTTTGEYLGRAKD